ncbi:MAG: hypothetical protein U1E58_14050 [Tabrizicola sp.]
MHPLLLPALALLILGLWLAIRLVEASRERTAARAAFFDAVTPLFASVEQRIEPTGFPRMTGRHYGHAFDLQAIPDTLTFRKLPALWVLITLPEPLPLEATVDLLARPSGNEPFTRFASLPNVLPGVPGLPREVAIHSDSGVLPPSDLLSRHADLFMNPQVKELVLSPRGLRIVILAEEADRGRYLIFREAEMGMTPLDPDRVAPLLDRLRALRKDVLTLAKDSK